jgi:putative GTP pyrophosphokinase
MNSQDPGLSRAAIDQLGDRLRNALSVDDLRLLDQYRREFRDDYDMVTATVRERLGLVPSGRPAKSTPAILDKLRRSSMRLSQMQDVAGCRVVVADIAAQDDAVARLQALFPSTTHDRREKASHGYRAVHVVVRPNKRPIEVQVRTELQHLWAELSEKSADAFGIDVKYGRGHKTIRAVLDNTSDLISQVERLESSLDPTEELLQVRREVASQVANFLAIVKGKQ